MCTKSNIWTALSAGILRRLGHGSARVGRTACAQGRTNSMNCGTSVCHLQHFSVRALTKLSTRCAKCHDALQRPGIRFVPYFSALSYRHHLSLATDRPVLCVSFARLATRAILFGPPTRGASVAHSAIR